MNCLENNCPWERTGGSSEGTPMGESLILRKGLIEFILSGFFNKILIMFYAYILFSEKLGKYYYGHTKDLDERLKTHAKGKVKFTKPGRPWKLVYIVAIPKEFPAIPKEKLHKKNYYVMFVLAKSISS